VIASLWKVDDAATAALMTLFYRHLWEDKLPPIEALRRAQLEVHRNPGLIPRWAKGERAPDVKGVRPPTGGDPKANTDASVADTDGLASIRQWAAFTLSGMGR
jgi:CHAT domain-containing protein